MIRDVQGWTSLSYGILGMKMKSRHRPNKSCRFAHVLKKEMNLTMPGAQWVMALSQDIMKILYNVYPLTVLGLSGQSHEWKEHCGSAWYLAGPPDDSNRNFNGRLYAKIVDMGYFGKLAHSRCFGGIRRSAEWRFAPRRASVCTCFRCGLGRIWLVYLGIHRWLVNQFVLTCGPLVQISFSPLVSGWRHAIAVAKNVGANRSAEGPQISDPSSI